MRRLRKQTPARAENLRPQSMSSTVAALQALGAITDIADSVDGRQTLITLTDTFRQRLEAHRSAKNDWLHGHPRNAAVRHRTSVAYRHGQIAGSGLPLLTRLSQIEAKMAVMPGKA